MPVVFNLSSWAQRQPTLAGWLVDELHDSYDVPRRIAKAWVDADEILPLLDGLGEVAPLAACVTAINEFLDDHFVGLAVCSSAEEYQTAATPLQLV